MHRSNCRLARNLWVELDDLILRCNQVDAVVNCAPDVKDREETLRPNVGWCFGIRCAKSTIKAYCGVAEIGVMPGAEPKHAVIWTEATIAVSGVHIEQRGRQLIAKLAFHGVDFACGWRRKFHAGL